MVHKAHVINEKNLLFVSYQLNNIPFNTIAVVNTILPAGLSCVTTTTKAHGTSERHLMRFPLEKLPGCCGSFSFSEAWRDYLRPTQ